MSRPAAPPVVLVVPLALALLLAAAPAAAYDEAEVWKPWTWMGSLEGGYGAQFNLERHRKISDIEYLMVGARVSVVPFGVIGGASPLRGAIELGVEPVYLRYTEPPDAFYAGAAAVGRYHFTGQGRVVPYVELGAAAGGTDLRVSEIDSDVSFLLLGGLGVSYFIGDRQAVYAGYRLMHNSNGNTNPRNRGWEAHTGVVGVSLFFE